MRVVRRFLTEIFYYTRVFSAAVGVPVRNTPKQGERGGKTLKEDMKNVSSINEAAA